MSLLIVDEEKVYVGDVGTVIYLDTGEDMSSASVMKIKVKKPDASTVEWTAALDVTNTNRIKYVVVADDLDQDGTYRLQAYCVTPLWSGLGETAQLKVYNPFE